MERLLNTATWRRGREEQRYQPASSQLIPSRTSALSSHISHDMPGRMGNEKDALRGLNERFAGFIERVHYLESQNQALERELEDVRLKAMTPACLAKQYEPELQELRRQVREIAMQKQRVQLEQQRLEDDFQTLREKCESEARSRSETEESISALKKYMDNAHLAKQDMARKATVLVEEIDFLKKSHDAEVAELLVQVQGASQLHADTRGFGSGELAAALRDIRTQLEGRAICPVSQPEQRFQAQLAKLTKAAEADRAALLGSRAELSEYRRQLQDRSVELDSARGVREALQTQLDDLQQRHLAEIHHYQDTIRELDSELKNTKYDMSRHVQEYQDLLNVKMALDAEIYSYRKLLEGEESRYSILTDAHISAPYVYRQSPVYTLPTVSRMGGTRKTEPQYKFVEEIITETTREDIEMLDTGSDDGEIVGGGDKLCSKEEDETIAAVEDENQLEVKEIQDSPAEDQTDNSNTDRQQNQALTENEENTLLNESDLVTEQTREELAAPECTDEKVKDDSTKAAPESPEPTPEISEIKITCKEEVTKKDKEPEESTEQTDEDKIQPTEQKRSNEQLIEPDFDTTKVVEPKEESKQTQGELPLPECTDKKEKDSNSTKAASEIPEPTPEISEVKTTEKVKEPEESTEQSDEDKIQPTEEKDDKKAEHEIGKEQTSTAVMHEDSPSKNLETSEVKNVEADTTTADLQPASKKAESGQETLPEKNSQAETKETVEKSKADEKEHKAEDTQDNAEKAVKELKTKTQAEDIQKEIPANIKEKETESEESSKKTVESKSKTDTEPVKAVKEESSPAKEKENVEEKTKSENEIKDKPDSAKKEAGLKLKDLEKQTDQKQIEEPPINAEADATKTMTDKNAKAPKEEGQKKDEKKATELPELDKKSTEAGISSKSADSESKDENNLQKKDTQESNVEDLHAMKGEEIAPADAEDKSMPKILPENKDQNKTVTAEAKDVEAKPDSAESNGKEHSIRDSMTMEKSDAVPKASKTLPEKGETTKKSSEISSPPKQDEDKKTATTDLKADSEQKADRSVPVVAENGVKA